MFQVTATKQNTRKTFVSFSAATHKFELFLVAWYLNMYHPVLLKELFSKLGC